MTAANPESILDTVKKVIGFDPDYEVFDLDITMFTNGALASLKQLGVGSDTGFMIADNTTLWSQFVSNLVLLGMVKQFIFLTVKLAFDPPATSFGIDAIKAQIQEWAWRINVEAETVSPPSDPFTSQAVAGVPHIYIAPKTQVLEFASTVTADASVANMFYLTLTGDCTINAPINGVDGEHITIEVTSNGHAVTWGNGWNFGIAGTPNLTPSKTDVVSAYFRETVADWRAGFIAGF